MTAERSHPADAPHDFHQVAHALEDAAEILVVGPSMAKLEFIKHVHKDDHALVPKIVCVETLDHPTDARLGAYARRYFGAPDRIRRLNAHDRRVSGGSVADRWTCAGFARARSVCAPDFFCWSPGFSGPSVDEGIAEAVMVGGLIHEPAPTLCCGRRYPAAIETASSCVSPKGPGRRLTTSGARQRRSRTRRRASSSTASSWPPVPPTARRRAE